MTEDGAIPVELDVDERPTGIFAAAGPSFPETRDYTGTAAAKERLPRPL